MVNNVEQDNIYDIEKSKLIRMYQELLGYVAEEAHKGRKERSYAGPNYLSLPSFPPYSDFDKWIKEQTNQLLNAPATEYNFKSFEANILCALNYYKRCGYIQNEDLFVKYVLLGNDLELSICCLSPKIISMAEEVLNYKNGITNVTPEETFYAKRNFLNET